jgi:antitoxin Phd
MSSPATQRNRHTGKTGLGDLGRWKLEDAKARLSEVVRRAATEGPQLVTVRGKDAAVILTPEEYHQLLPPSKSHKPLTQFLRGLSLSTIVIEREVDSGRDIAL